MAVIRRRDDSLSTPTSARAANSLVGPIAARVTGPPALRALVRSMLPPARAYAEDAPPEAGAVVPVLVSPGAPDDGGAPVAWHELATISRDGRGHVVVRGAGVSARADDHGVFVRVEPAAAPELVRLVLDMIWPVVLARFGYFHLHAAAVRDPDGRGWILAGEANAGKSTSTLALARAGWAYAGDDAVYLAAAADGAVVAHGWEEPVRLSAEAAAALDVPRVRGAPGVKTPALVAADLSRLRTPSIQANRLLFPQIGPTTAHERVSASSALARLVRAAPCIMVQPTLAQAYLTVLGRAAALPAGVLTLGAELLGDPLRLAAFLTESSRA